MTALEALDRGWIWPNPLQSHVALRRDNRDASCMASTTKL